MKLNMRVKIYLLLMLQFSNNLHGLTSIATSFFTALVKHRQLMRFELIQLLLRFKCIIVIIECLLIYMPGTVYSLPLPPPELLKNTT